MCWRLGTCCIQRAKMEAGGWMTGGMNAQIKCLLCEDSRWTQSCRGSGGCWDQHNVNTHISCRYIYSMEWQEPDKWKKNKKLQRGQGKTNKFKWKIPLLPLLLPLSLPSSSPICRLPPSNAPVLQNKNDNTFPETHTQTHTFGALHWEVWEAVIDHISLLISLMFQITK